MAPPIALLVGLGNPGARYGHTRHNAGFWFLDRLAEREQLGFRALPRFHGEGCDLRSGERVCRLFKPQTYMNHSGRAVGAIAHYYRYPIEELLVVHDEVDLPVGAVRLKRAGGHGGHRGLRDVMAVLGVSEFTRLRIGVGHPGQADQVVDYVLQSPPAEEREQIEEAIEQALDVFPLVLAGELERAMNTLHRRVRAAASGSSSTDAETGTQES